MPMVGTFDHYQALTRPIFLSCMAVGGGHAGGGEHLGERRLVANRSFAWHGARGDVKSAGSGKPCVAQTVDTRYCSGGSEAAVWGRKRSGVTP